MNSNLSKVFSELSTPLIADACVRQNIPLRITPPGIQSIYKDHKLAGCVLPVRHYGSVDVFLEVLYQCDPGDVLVIDNQGRTDEGCIGDLTVLEVKNAGLAGIVLWGYHRDTMEIAKIDFPVFSYGSCPAGPLRVDSRESDVFTSAQFGDFQVTREEVVFADGDGVLFVPKRDSEHVLAAAEEIHQTERRQIDLLSKGETLRAQLRYDEFIETRKKTPEITFREHLKNIGGAIEE